MIYRSPFNRSAPFKSFTEVPDVSTVPNVPVVQWLRYGTPVQMFKVRGLMAVQGSNVQKFKGRLSDVPAVPSSRRFNYFAWFIMGIGPFKTFNHCVPFKTFCYKRCNSLGLAMTHLLLG